MKTKTDYSEQFFIDIKTMPFAGRIDFKTITFGQIDQLENIMEQLKNVEDLQCPFDRFNNCKN